MSDQDRTLELEQGDDCPEDCDLTVHVNEYDVSGLHDDVEPEGPVAEAFCPHHGIVESV